MIVAVSAITALCVLQACVAVRRSGALRIVLLSQSVFWLLAYAIRPTYLHLYKPNQPALLGDPRLSPSSYDGDFVDILWLAIIANGLYLLVIWLFTRPRKSPVPLDSWERLDLPRLVSTLLVIWSVGMVGRLLSFAGVSDFQSFLDPFAVVGGTLLIIFMQRSASSPLPLAVLAIVAVELAWSFSTGSKQDFIVPLLALMFRWFAVPGAVRPSWRVVSVTLAATMVGFFVIQAIRGISSDAALAVRTAAFGSPLAANALLIVERFDGFSAYVDAYFANHLNGWLSPAEYLGRLVYNLVPKGPWMPTVEGTLGQLWTREVRSQSFPDQYQDVSLAAGFGAEGYAVGGLGMMIASAVVFAIVVLLVTKAFDSFRPFLLTATAPILFAPALFEQGLLGLAGLLNKGLQVAICGYLVWLLIGAIQSGQRANKAVEWRSFATRAHT